MVSQGIAKACFIKKEIKFNNSLAFIQASRLEVANICEQFGSLGRYSSDSLDLNFNREVSNKAKNLFCKFRG